MRVMAQLRLRSLPLATNVLSLADLPPTSRTCSRCVSPGLYDDEEHFMLHCSTTEDLCLRHPHIFSASQDLRQLFQHTPAKLAPIIFSATQALHNWISEHPEWERMHPAMQEELDPCFTDSDHDSDQDEEDDEELFDALPHIDFDSIVLDPTIRVRLRQAPPPLTMVLRSSQSSQS